MTFNLMAVSVVGYTACRAKSNIIAVKVYVKLSEHPLPSIYPKGIYIRHSPLPKYLDIWDANNLFISHYDYLGHNENLNNKDLEEKKVMLFVIIGVKRKQALFSVSVEIIV